MVRQRCIAVAVVVLVHDTGRPSRTVHLTICCCPDVDVFRFCSLNRFNIYIESPNLESDIFHANFRRRFHMPYNSFLELVELANQDAIFCRWRRRKCQCNVARSDTHITSYFSVLRYLGRRGWTMTTCRKTQG
jgi:hypothetical protein